MVKVKAQLPTLDARNGHTVSTIIVALNGMMPGQYGDILTGEGQYDRAHVTRNENGSYKVVHIQTTAVRTGDNVLRLAQFIMDQVL